MLRYAASESPRTGALVVLLLGAGLRVSETLTARAEPRGVDVGHRVLAVSGRGDYPRQVPPHPQLQHALDLQFHRPSALG
ncbi:hypothetical protein [Streptomyces sp. NPDC002692]